RPDCGSSMRYPDPTRRRALVTRVGGGAAAPVARMSRGQTVLPKEGHMHSPLLTVAGAGLGVILLATSPANAITLTAPSGVRLAAAPLALIEAVHCRRYLHWHSRE